MSPLDSTTHLVVVPLQEWGHTRPLTGLVTRIVQARPITVTYFVPKYFHERVSIELSRHLGDVPSINRKSIRLVALPCSEDNVIDMVAFYSAFAGAYTALIKQEPVTCAHTGITMNRAPSPTVAIIDIFMLPAADIVRKSTHKVLEPYEADALGFLRAMYERRAIESGKTLEDVVQEALVDLNDQLIKLPGLPAMYDYEHTPQVVTDLKESPLLHLALIESLTQCEGLITSSPECLDSTEALESLRRWFSKTSRRIYSCGPLMPLGVADTLEQEMAMSADAAKILGFLQVIGDNGPTRVVYMSFGSLFWPSEPAKAWAFIDVLLEKKIPFIFSHGSPYSAIPDNIVEKVNQSGLGLLTRWAPQQTVLAHPAVGWFVTHAGFNSLAEAVVNGVPMICWPFFVDQPINAAHLTENLDIAYELFEVRTGEHGLKPIHRIKRAPVGTVNAVREEAAAILDKAFGDDGVRKRAKISQLREKVLAAWDENGSSRLDVQALVKDMTGI